MSILLKHLHDRAAHAHPNPTEGQQRAGNYRKGHLKATGRRAMMSVLFFNNSFYGAVRISKTSANFSQRKTAFMHFLRLLDIYLTLRFATNCLYSAPFKGIPHASVRNTNLASYIACSNTAFCKAFSLFNPFDFNVFFGVLLGGQNNKIARIVVPTIVIFVMNYFQKLKRSTKNFLHRGAMRVCALAIKSDFLIWAARHLLTRSCSTTSITKHDCLFFARWSFCRFSAPCACNNDWHFALSIGRMQRCQLKLGGAR